MSHRTEHMAIVNTTGDPEEACPAPQGESWVETDESTQDSVEFTQNAKGLFQLTVKCYFIQGDLLAGKAAVERAYQLWQDAARDFPLVPRPDQGPEAAALAAKLKEAK